MRRHSPTHSVRQLMLTGLGLAIVCGTVGASLASSHFAAETATDPINPTTPIYEKSSSSSFSITIKSSYICNVCIFETTTKGTQCIPTEKYVSCDDPACTMRGTSCIVAGGTMNNPVYDFQYPESNTAGGTTGDSDDDDWMHNAATSPSARSSSSWSLWNDGSMSSNRSSSSSQRTSESRIWDYENARPPATALCIMKQSACPPDDTSCLSPTSFVQLSCTDARCAMGGCVAVDQWLQQMQNTSAPSNSRSSEWFVPDTTRTDSSLPSKDEDETDTPNLGCFRADGTWTKDRNECDTNQSRHLQTVRPTDSPVPSGPVITDVRNERDVRRKIEEKFFTDDVRMQQLDELLRPATDAIGRLNLLLAKDVLPAEAEATVQQTVDWLQQIQISFSEGNQSMEDIREKAEEVRTRLEQIAQLIATALQSQGTPVVTTPNRPDSVLTKLDTIFDVMPAAFSLMQQQGVTVPNAALDGYLDAQRQYDAVKTSCMLNSNECSKLSQVISLLEPVVTSIRQALQNSGRADLEATIQAMMQK